MNILHSCVIDFELCKQIRPDEVIGLYSEILHFENHAFHNVHVLYGDLWRLDLDLLLLDCRGGLLAYVLVLALHLRQLTVLLCHLGHHVLLDPLRVLEYLLHRVRRGRPMLLEDLRDLVDRGGQVLDVGPLTEGLRSTDQVLHVVVLSEVRILQVFVVPEEKRGEVQGKVTLSLNLGCKGLTVGGFCYR